MPILLLLFVIPVVILGLIVWAFVRGSHKTRIITGILCIVLISLLFIPHCKPIDLSKEDYNPVTGAMQGQALLTWLEDNKARNLSTGRWKQKNGAWYKCWSGSGVIREVYRTFWEENTARRVLIQGK